MSLATARYTAFSNSLASQLPRGWLLRRCLYMTCSALQSTSFLFIGYWANSNFHRTAVTGVTYIKEKPDLILMHDDNTIAVLDKEKDMPEPSAKVIYQNISRLNCLSPGDFNGFFLSWCTMIHDRHHQTTSLRMARPTVPV